MARVLVTGGAGFIGSHIVDRLLALGNELCVLDDLSSGSLQNLPSTVLFKKADVRSKEAAEFVAAQNPQVIVHTAAQISVRKSMEDPHFDADVNLMGLLNLLRACKKDALPYITFLSTGGALYGDQDVYPASETHRIAPPSAYGVSKYCAELYLNFWHRQYGLCYSALRLANVYGPRQNPHGEAGVVAIFCEKLLSQQTPLINGDGKQTRDFVFVGDVVAAVDRVIDLRIQGVFNIGTGQETSINAIYAGLLKASGLKTKADYGPAKFGEQLRSVIDPKLALASFSWSPGTEVNHGLKLTFDWFMGKKQSG